MNNTADDISQHLEARHIGFIGAGNMAGSLIRGLVARQVPGSQIHASDIDADKLNQLATECGIQTSDMASLAGLADVIILSVKPQVMRDVCEQLAQHLARPDCLIISIAAGISLQSLEQWLGAERPIVRCMPNTPALVGEGASGLFANSHCNAEHQRLADVILRAVGISCWLQAEKDIDTVTALSGSGPAYFFLLMEAMEQAGTELGLSADVARQLAVQTALGAGRLAASSDVGPDELRRRVTSPGGTTEQALLSFARDDFENIVARAMQAARDRAAELARELAR